MYKISLGFERTQELPLCVRERMRDMVSEYSDKNGIDWQLEYRWATFTEHDFLLAKLKYNDILSYMMIQTA